MPGSRRFSGAAAGIHASAPPRKSARWRNGGWLRLDGTPAADVGSAAANRSTLGAWQARLHSLQRYWESYIADMDREKQQSSVYKPVQDALHDFMSGLISPAAWRAAIGRWWDALARTFKSGIIGKLISVVFVLAVGAMLVLAAWWLACAESRQAVVAMAGPEAQRGACSGEHEARSSSTTASSNSRSESACFVVSDRRRGSSPKRPELAWRKSVDVPSFLIERCMSPRRFTACVSDNRRWMPRRRKPFSRHWKN